MNVEAQGLEVELKRLKKKKTIIDGICLFIFAVCMAFTLKDMGNEAGALQGTGSVFVDLSFWIGSVGMLALISPLIFGVYFRAKEKKLKSAG